MVKKRVHELAKEFNIESREIIIRLGQMGVSVKSHMSTVEDSDVEIIKQQLGSGVAGEQPKTGPKPTRQTQARPAGAPTGEKRRQERQPDRYGSQRPGDRRDRDPGPGLVDRVPSRPPDRRFQERPVRGQSQPDTPPGGALVQSEGRVEVPRETGPQDPARSQDTKSKQFDQASRPRPGVQAGGDGKPFHRTDNRTDNRPADVKPGVRPPQGRPQSPQGRPQSPQGRPPHPAQGQGRPPYPAQGQGRPPHPAQGQGRPPYPAQGQGRPPHPAQGQGRPPHPAQGQGRPPYPAQGQGRPPYPAQGQGRPQPSPGPRTRPDQAAKQLKAIEKTKPDTVKAQEKTKAQERAKQVEKQNFRDAGKTKRFGDKPNNEKRNLGSGNQFPGARRKPNRGPKKASRPQQERLQPVEKKPVAIGDSITVQDLAQKIRVNASDIIKKLMQMGVMATINNDVDYDTAAIIAGEFGYEVEAKVEVDPEAILHEQEGDPANLSWRPCVVTVMGHVDHGKTSLLDSIRETNVTASEAGGITQHIGAYQVEHGTKKITFVDTPGHAAFTAMRARGAKVTDIAVLVVAADDGVMPQTVEAINHAKAAQVPIIVAINKMDKPEANPDRIKRELTEHQLLVEDWGGETICVEVSAKEKTGLKELLEMILLVAEMGELKADPDQEARGTVVEAELDKGRGPVATVLVQNGTLRVGDVIIAGVALGRVRAMMDYTGRRVKKAGPSTPVEVLGFSEVPAAGELFYAVQDDKIARNIVAKRQVKKREEDLKSTVPRVTLEDLFKYIQEGQVKELCVIIKSDVQGSTEALKQSLERLSNDEVKVNIIHGGVGAITETDIMLASASNAIIIGFNVRPDVNTRRAAESEKVDIRLYRVIYDAIEDVKAAMSGLLDPEYREVVLGRTEIRQIFKVSKVGTIAGCYVQEGKINRDAGVRVIRDGIVVHEGKLDSLKRFKDDVKEVAQGYECGLTMEKYNELREGDIIEAFAVETIKRELA